MRNTIKELINRFKSESAIKGNIDMRYLEEAIKIAIAEDYKMNEIPQLTHDLAYSYACSDAQELTAKQRINQELENEINGITTGEAIKLTMVDLFNTVKEEINQESGRRIYKIEYPVHKSRKNDSKEGYKTYIDKAGALKIKTTDQVATKELVLAKINVVNGKKITVIGGKTEINPNWDKMYKKSRIQKLTGIQDTKIVAKAIKDHTKLTVNNQEWYVAYREVIKPGKKHFIRANAKRDEAITKSVKDIESKFLTKEQRKLELEKRYMEKAIERLNLRDQGFAEVWFNNKPYICRTEAIFEDRKLVKVTNTPIEDSIEVLYNQKKELIEMFIQEFKQVKNSEGEYDTVPDGELLFTLVNDTPDDQITGDNYGKHVLLTLDDCDRNEGGVEPINSDSRPYNYDDQEGNLIEKILDEIIYG